MNLEFLDKLFYNITHLSEWMLLTFGGKNYFETMGIILFDLWLWPIVLYLFMKYIFLELWLDYRKTLFKAQQTYTLLAIDVPKKNEQSIAAMENVFAQILGAESTPNMYEKWWKGEFQLHMTCEIVSIDGFIQLLIRIPSSWRDIVEGAIYGQFPDAEITEVEDYVNNVPSVYPNETHDMWGVEFSLDNKVQYYPIKTYLEFEDSFNDVFVDPLAGLLEAMSKCGKGEQVWFHILCTPLLPSWWEGATAEIDKILGKETKKEVKTPLYSAVTAVGSVVNSVTESALGVRPLGEKIDSDSKTKDDPYGKMQKLSPGQRSNLEALERKISKPGYAVKIRYGYFAEKAVMSKPRGVSAIIGAMKQFTAHGRNGLRPQMKKTATKANYFYKRKRVAYRQKKLVAALKKRHNKIGMPKSLMCTEELATLFHFPSMFVRAPMLKRTELIKSEAPTNLPFEEQVLGEADFDELPGVESGLPVAEEGFEHSTGAVDASQYSFDYDSDEFERKFAKDKAKFEASRPQRQELLEKIEKEELESAEVSQPILQTSQVQEEVVDSIDSKGVDEILDVEKEFAQDIVVEPFTGEVSVESETSPHHFKHHENIKEETGLPLPQKMIDLPDRVEYETEILGFFVGHEAGAEKKIEKKKAVDEEPPANLPFV